MEIFCSLTVTVFLNSDNSVLLQLVRIVILTVRCDTVVPAIHFKASLDVFRMKFLILYCAKVVIISSPNLCHLGNYCEIKNVMNEEQRYLHGRDARLG